MFVSYHNTTCSYSKLVETELSQRSLVCATDTPCISTTFHLCHLVTDEAQRAKKSLLLFTQATLYVSLSI